MELEDFELDKEGVGQLLKSEEMAELITEYGETVRQKCVQGSVPADEFESITKLRGDRVGAVVHPATPRAYYSNRKNNTLLKALGASKS